MKCAVIFFLALVVSMTITPSLEASGYSFVGITSNGVKFPIKSSSDGTGNGDGTGDGAGDGQSMIDGMGLQSRIIQQEYDAKLISGSGVIGKANSIVPYLQVSSDTDFVALIDNTDTVLTHYIPEFWKSYRFDSGLVDTTPDKPNILTYSNSKSMSGTNDIQLTHDGIVVSGTGTVVIKLNPLDEDFIIKGILNSGNVKLVTSYHDLSKHAIRGDNFVLGDYTLYGTQVSSTSSEHLHRCLTRGCGWHTHNAYTYHFTANTNIIISKDSPLTTSTTTHCTSYYNNPYHYECSNSPRVGLTVSIVPEGKHITKLKIVENTSHNERLIPSASYFNVAVLSTAPYSEKYNFVQNFNQKISLPPSSYLIVTLDGGSTVIRGELVDDDNSYFLKIDSLDANIP